MLPSVCSITYATGRGLIETLPRASVRSNLADSAIMRPSFVSSGPPGRCECVAWSGGWSDARVTNMGGPPFLLTMPAYGGTLAAARCLGERGVSVTMAGDTLLAPARWSRYVTRWETCPPVLDAA